MSCWCVFLKNEQELPKGKRLSQGIKVYIGMVYSEAATVRCAACGKLETSKENKSWNHSIVTPSNYFLIINICPLKVFFKWKKSTTKNNH